jgi:hypothetical protein
MTAAHGLHYPLELPSRMLPADALFWYAEQATPVFSKGEVASRRAGS